ncbi:MAG: tyrosine--tRNA ligase [Caldilineaceae bacterium]|nr:tyrosine--tRNA ligase [Caldilineaceae bacterium]
MKNIFEDWQWRKLCYDSTDGLAEVLGKEPITVYNGFDPTADSLHVGHLVPMVGLARFQRFGHHPIALAGGGTGMIGDPSGRSAERNLLSADVIAHNVDQIKGQLASILDFEVKSNPARLVNNIDWLSQISMIAFLRDVGKHFTINYMTAKDSVQSRLEREDGLSYTEFSYMLLQAYDYLYLHEHYGCRLQAGGSDQWGNITAGVTLIRKVHSQTVHGVVYPLITRADGTKFGKTADGDSVWLDPKRTSPYRFYQFFMNMEDANVVQMLRFYTFLPQTDLDEYAHAVAERPHLREAQRRLAQEVTRMVHGESGLTKAEQATKVFFGEAISGLSATEIREIFADAPSTAVSQADFAEGGLPVVNLLERAGVAKSRGEARRLISSGGIYLNNVRLQEADQSVPLQTAIEGQYLVIRRGKKDYYLVQVNS